MQALAEHRLICARPGLKHHHTYADGSERHGDTDNGGFILGGVQQPCLALDNSPLTTANEYSEPWQAL